jgi:3-oxoacyl-[acyl-carrier-protein] synthase-3
MRNSKIIGMGFYVPEKVVTNHDLAKLMDTSDEWIRERTGIVERRYAAENQGTADLAKEATVRALDDAKLETKDIDLIVFATLSPDHLFPGSGCVLQSLLPFPNHCAAMDIRAQCSGFIYALTVADQFIKTGMYDRVLVVGSEVHSTGLEFATRGRDVTVIFGDGAGAVVLGPTDDPKQGILSSHLYANGEHYNKLWVPSPGSKSARWMTHEMIDNGQIYPHMDGKFIFRHAIEGMSAVILEALNANHYTVADLDLVVPHQANMRINQMVGKKLGLPDHKMIHNIQKYGNTTAATIPIGLCEAREQGLLKPGSLVCLAAFGAGLTWAASLIRW